MRQITAINRLQYLTPDFHPFDNIVCGFFTRSGGVSPTPFKSLNISISTGDNLDNVVENRDRIFHAIGRPVSSMFDVWQTHSDVIVCTDNPRSVNAELQKADAIFTRNPDVTLMMRFADCVPILIYDPVESVVGIIHAGWQGTVNEIAAKSIRMIVSNYGCKAENIHAVIGPSIGPDHYEVRENVVREARRVFQNDEQIINTRGDQYFFNLWQANQQVLSMAGVSNVHQTEVCTACDTESWFSHRAESGKTGRFAAVITLAQ
jgi:hypothetical protein